MFLMLTEVSVHHSRRHHFKTLCFRIFHTCRLYICLHTITNEVSALKPQSEISVEKTNHSELLGVVLPGQ